MTILARNSDFGCLDADYDRNHQICYQFTPIFRKLYASETYIVVFNSQKFGILVN